MKYHFQRQRHSNVALTKAELQELTSELTEDELQDLKLEAYNNALNRAVRSVRVLFDISSNLGRFNRNPEIESPFDLDELDAARPSGEEFDHRNVLEKFQSLYDFNKYPNMQTDLERLLEMEAVVAMSNEDFLRAALEEIYADNHSDQCAEIVIKRANTSAHEKRK